MIDYLDEEGLSRFKQKIDEEFSSNGGSQNIWKTVYPVGTVYISYNSTSPAELFGGSWTQLTGRFLRANNGTGTGGADTITLTAAQSGLPSHSHSIVYTNAAGSGSTAMADVKACTNTRNITGYITNTGGTSASSSHSNTPAYQDLYVWYRTE